MQMQELARLVRLACGHGHPAPQCLLAQGRGHLQPPAPATTRAMSQAGRSYEDAVAALNSLQSNASLLQEIKGSKHPHSNVDKLALTRLYLEKIGVGMKELSQLSVIHVAGTKGKGSTSAYCESILRHNGYSTGFFSSPHLVSVRERIRLNGQPISTQKFTSYFWHAFDALQEKKNPDMSKPAYFYFLTVMALRVFIEEQVDVAIIEVGIGGECDCTNILKDVSVVGITSLGMDHTALLGNTLSSIAWQKAGILKPTAVGYTVQGHTPEVLKVLNERSLEKSCPLEIAPPLDQYTWPDEDSREAVLSLFWTQQLNASLALQLTSAWMKRGGKCISDDASPLICTMKNASAFSVSGATVGGLLECRWPGRNQVLVSDCGRIKYFLDGAHTIESMLACVEWYKKACPPRPSLRRALLVNLTGDRDRFQIITPLLTCKFDKVIFSPNIAISPSLKGDAVNLRVPLNGQIAQTQALHDAWVSLIHSNGLDLKKNGAPSYCMNTIITKNVNEALAEVQNESEEWSVLVTGSLHLVGAVLSVIDPSLDKSEKSSYSTVRTVDLR